MSIWKDTDWNYNSKTINAILPILYIGLTEYKAKINGDISGKILSYIYYNEMFNSPIKINIPLSLSDIPVRPKKLSRRLFKLNILNFYYFYTMFHYL
jgi:hypothetical protein